ncbi:uncharacterized protein UHO2_00352 [Ustilago hordei]|uniref:uncharacterized protein n=1 Tax=Ustilago hordei TaxID=120017 RepID=UPI001A5ABC28|nr:uncharacterized protein UHO2_00352 [Ustilago hordei]SYW81847.1 uncharacterized protein UHO2_00352 [Ustilago hordei]
MQFSKLEQSGTAAFPPQEPVIARNSQLLQSYTWLPLGDVNEEPDANDIGPPSLIPYSCQCNTNSCLDTSNISSYDCKWDQMMAEIEDAGEVVMDLDTIATDLRAKLDTTPSNEGNNAQNPVHTDLPTLETPQSNATMDIYDNVSVLEINCMGLSDSLDPLRYMAFAVKCSSTQTPTISNHHLDCMAFAVMVMNGVALVVSGQQMHSADRILLEPLSLNKAKMHDDWHKWKEAMASKMVSMDKMNIFELANIPTDGKLIGI